MAKRRSRSSPRSKHSGRSVDSLHRKRIRLVQAIEELDARIAAAGGVPPGRKRPTNAETLVDALHRLLTGRQLSVLDAADQVQRAGYVTTSRTFGIAVNQTLINYPKRFKRVSRGVYTARG